MHKHQEPIDRFCSNHILSFCSSQKTLNQGQKLWLAQLGSQAHTLIREGWATWWVVSTRRYLIEQWLPHRQTGFCYWAPPAQVLRERYWICPICLMTTHSSLLPSFPCAYAYLDRRETSQPSPVVGEWQRGWGEMELWRTGLLVPKGCQCAHQALWFRERRPNRIWQRWWYMISEMSLWIHHGSCLSTLSLSLGSFTLEEASFHVMSSPRGKDLVERNWGLWPTARKVLKPTRKSHRREVESRFSRPSQPFRWLQPWPTSWCNLMRDTESELPT